VNRRVPTSACPRTEHPVFSPLTSEHVGALERRTRAQRLTLRRSLRICCPALRVCCLGVQPVSETQSALSSIVGNYSAGFCRHSPLFVSRFGLGYTSESSMEYNIAV
jgi:hypothetical protein